MIMTTLTGADNNTEVSDLELIWAQHKNVEFALLHSPTTIDRPRYPCRDKIVEMLDFAESLRFALHLCGGSVLKAYNDADDNLSSYLDILNETESRCQLNFKIRSNRDMKMHRAGIESLINRYPRIRFIVQDNNENAEFVSNVLDELCLDVLQDRSGGRGITPSDWEAPKAKANAYGFAGGLSPNKIVDELVKIKATGASNFWVDLESGLRSQKDERNTFDISKCVCVLDRVAAFNTLD